MIERGGEVYSDGHVRRAEADSHFEGESSPANVSARAEGGRWWDGGGVNAQFVFRSAEKTRSLHRIASTHSPKLVADVLIVVVVVVGFPSRAGFIFMTTPRAREIYELRARCINFPLGSRRFLRTFP